MWQKQMKAFGAAGLKGSEVLLTHVPLQTESDQSSFAT